MAVLRPTLVALCAALALPWAAAEPLASNRAATVDEAVRFIENAEVRLLELSAAQQRAAWVQSNFITDDTEAISAEAQKQLTAATMELAAQAKRFDGLKLPVDVARKLMLLKVANPVPAPSDPKALAEMADLTTWLEGTYGKGKYCKAPGECKDLEQLSNVLATSRDPAALLEAWRGWRTISPPMRGKYERFVQLGNQGAKELGFNDLGALWRAGYDMPPDDFAVEVDRLWGQVKPLYDALHCYVRSRLQAKYGKDLVPDGKPIPAHLLGNMWAQTWDNVYDMVAPPKEGTPVDLDALLAKKKIDQLEMVRYGERFYLSLGFQPLPKTFWERSLFKRPADRDVVCHASAWDVDFIDDLRLKMCIKIDAEDFSTVHHELGHNYYQRAYNKQPFMFRDSANDGFHEAIGDTLALSITPEYLVKVGLLDKAPENVGDIDMLMRKALEKIAFLPFGIMVDQWRWQVFAGKVPPARYNAAWWELARKYQGIAPPVERGEGDFDPGAKYHVAANVPYTRYFLADIMQFQFHRALCRTAGVSGPLHRCSIYGNTAAGAKLGAMLAMGKEKPWPEELAAMTGERQMDATAILDYFKPLAEWLAKQNQGQACGWK